MQPNTESSTLPLRTLPYGRQTINDDDIAAVVAALKSDFLTTGPLVSEFESKLASFSGATSAIAVNSGTSALHAAYSAVGVGPGTEIITSPLTFAATANVALMLGASVRFADVDPQSGCIDPDEVRQLITEKTRVVVPVDFAGHPADYDSVRRVIDQNSMGAISIVADAAHSLGATYKGRSVGTLADATAISLHPVKPITTGEGGAVLTSTPQIAFAAGLFRSHGIDRSIGLDEPWLYEQHSLGLNYRLTDLQCALGISQLRRIDSFLEKRSQIAGQYSLLLADVDGLELPLEAQDVTSGWHLYVVRVPSASHRRKFFDLLSDQGIRAQVHYVPVYWHPFYKDLGFARNMCPVAEDIYERSVSIPLFPGMDQNDIDHVVEAVCFAATSIWA
jgi:UDP-4-amino-4,6-dideoxy-N-acetyl-beta-L-altrosamine transaminase